MQGRVIFFDKATSAGRISGSDGNRYDFTQANLKQPVQPSVGMDVDFEASGTTARDIYVLGSGTASSGGTYVGEVEPDLGFFGYGWRAATAKYVTFSGRARRKEYWAFSVIYILFLVVAAAILFPVAANASENTAVAMFVIFGLIFLGGALPTWAINFRRLHDIGQPGWIFVILVLIGMIPYIGALISFIAFIAIGAIDSQPHENKYGVPMKRA
ncbi:DUF805 domain-containing protein [Cereibacter johrii]|uniref:DUF805 domain-containing protein n=1 Tax=Cereibacter johrii TaxID=445629 RepID=UPI000DCBB910|nr:DUF805 domain-containing protein [Cereibacter johrii]RAZ83825.1 hypothetical protein DDV93_16210 [Cereibacter johrii]RDS94869.1 DUF805 domain-containing protein [Cereibacter sphaeroides f. sp. denitrificans]